MSKLTVVIFAVLVIMCVRSLADPSDDNNKEDVGLDKDDRSASSRRQTMAAAGRPQSQYTQPAFTECYICTDCPEVSDNTTTKYCPASNDRSKQNKCVIYSEKYGHMKNPWHIRGCASERGSCADIRKAHEHHEHIVTLLSCVECEGDRCNGVSRSLPNFVTSLILFVVTPIFGKYTLS